VYESFLDVGLNDVITTLLTPSTYTCWEYYTTHNRAQEVRFDHFLIPTPLVSQVQQLTVLHKYRTASTPSDHAPVLLTVETYLRFYLYVSQPITTFLLCRLEPVWVALCLCW
jgi:exonuclease III